MGTTKTDLFNRRHNELSKIAKALGHPARIAMIEYLQKKENCICNDFVEKFPLAQPTISQHLKELKNSGLIQGKIRGNTICYYLNKKTLERYKMLLKSL